MEPRKPTLLKRPPTPPQRQPTPPQRQPRPPQRQPTPPQRQPTARQNRSRRRRTNQINGTRSMDTTAASLLGDQLRDFLVKQFAPAPGTQARLGFLGAGVAVAPDSFLSQGQFNPARVNSWLNIV